MSSTSFTLEHLSEDSLRSFCMCLEDWSDEMKDAGTLKCDWVKSMKERGLGVRMARNEKGEYVGMIQYLPAEYSSVDAPGFYHIYCCWVHSYRGKGVGDWRGRGIGKALLAAAEEDIRERGARGITAWGLTIPVWMKASWYRKQGYRKADTEGMAALMWKPLTEDAEKPAWRMPAVELSEVSGSAQVQILSVVGGICPSMNISQERLRLLAGEYGEKVDYRRILIRTQEDVERWGLTDGLYLNGRAVSAGPPRSVKKLRRLLDREMKVLRRR